MIRARCHAVLLACTMASPAVAQQATIAPTPVAKAGDKAPGPDIVVQGLKDRKRGTWRRADGAHVVVYSKGSADELSRVTRNIERLHQLLTRLYRRGGGADDMVRPQITLLDPDTDLSSLGLQNARWQQGPFMAPFATTVYYDPREDGEVMAVSRRDTSIKLNTVRAFNEDCDDVVQNAGTDAVALCSKMAARRDPLGVAWERSLYAAYAERFILTYAPASDPRWYLDGIGALFSSIAIRPDGAIDYARVPDRFQQVLTAYGPVDVAGVLTGRYLTDSGDAARWSPYHAWLVSHFFLYSPLSQQRSDQFRHYMAAVRQGTSLAEAATVFGDLGALQREIGRYARRDFAYAHGQAPQPDVPPPAVTQLSPADSALVEARLALGGRGDGWLDTVRAATTGVDDPDALRVAATAECGGGHADACLAAADRVLASRPEDSAALASKGRALTLKAIAATGTDRTTGLAAARQVLGRAIALDRDAPAPRLAYVRSFLDAGQAPSDDAVLGLAQVIRRLPAAPMPRLLLAESLVKQGKADLAGRVAFTLTHGPFDSPERRAATALFASTGTAAHGS
ncbi:hypothetical protein DC429_10935 [Arthrobacter sp. TPD3018]|uniref:tetratricopeptide repeat protein n=1 Tax=Bacteria TaxID=2 RepID=UPI000D521E99|nr:MULTISPECIES: hypothetical protein [Bacteria]PVE55837.1 hypothetical protein DC425_10925 [Sphingomonas sp. TPD3009]PVE57578.1 hypothetical protein DC429_10935 [Arthrobacter sp. TPD3018]PVE83203.1 hypothetical protein DC431_10925 [Sphingomonas melonis]